MITIKYELGFGNNLISFPWIGLLDDTSTLNLLSSGTQDGSSVEYGRFNFILGQGVGLFNTADSWSGNLNNISPTKGYWLNVGSGAFETHLLTFEIDGKNAGHMYEVIHNAFSDVNLDFGNNLIACPINPNDFEGDYANPVYTIGNQLSNDSTYILLETISDNFTEGNIENAEGSEILFILGQGVGSFNTIDGWSGNLNQLFQGKGYWLNTDGSPSSNGEQICSSGTGDNTNICNSLSDTDCDSYNNNPPNQLSCYDKCIFQTDESSCNELLTCNWDDNTESCKSMCNTFTTHDDCENSSLSNYCGWEVIIDSQHPGKCVEQCMNVVPINQNWVTVCEYGLGGGGSCQAASLDCYWPLWINRQFDWSVYIGNPTTVCDNEAACNYGDDGDCILPDNPNNIDQTIVCCESDIVDCCLDANNTGLCDNETIYNLCDSGNDNVCDGYTDGNGNILPYIPNNNSVDVYGCMDDSACNYDDTATAEGECIYSEENFDCDGNCTAELDCNGECGGVAIEDCLGECGGDAVIDACGVCAGGAQISDCDECQDDGGCGEMNTPGDYSGCWYPATGCECVDGEGAVLDECNICGGDDSSCADCDGNPNGTAVVDDCNNCGGSCTSDADGFVTCPNITANVITADCLGVCDGGAVLDECGVCNGGGVPDDYCDCGTPKTELSCWDNSNGIDEILILILICANDSDDCVNYYDEISGDPYANSPEYDYGCPVLNACNYDAYSDGCTVEGEVVPEDDSCCIYESPMCPNDWNGFDLDYQEYILDTWCTPEAPAIQVGPGFNYLGFTGWGSVEIQQEVLGTDVVSLSFYDLNPDENDGAVLMDIPFGTKIFHDSIDYEYQIFIDYQEGISHPANPDLWIINPGWSSNVTFELEPGKGYFMEMPDDFENAWIKWVGDE